MRRLILTLLLATLLFILIPIALHASPLAHDAGTQTGTDIGLVLGTLGLYAAMMAVLAVGTEILVDAVRPLFGLKRKTTAAKALKDLQEWLPGSVEELGVSSEAQMQLNDCLAKLETVTTDFEDAMERVQTVVQEELPDILKDLAIHQVEQVFNAHWGDVRRRLRKVAPRLTEGQLDLVGDWLEQTLTVCKDTDVAEMAVYLQSLTNLLDAVRENRNANKLQAPVRRLWRWLRDGLGSVADKVDGIDSIPRLLRTVIVLLCRIPAVVQYLWAGLRRRLPDGDTFVERLKNLGRHEHFAPILNLGDAARRILEEESTQHDDENLRITYLRIISAVVGVVLAASLYVDSLQLLEPILGDTVNTFRLVEVTGQPGDWRSFKEIIDVRLENTVLAPERLPSVLGMVVTGLFKLTPGMILSGLGAAAGSGFWHDQLDKLRSTKRLVSRVQEMTG